MFGHMQLPQAANGDDSARHHAPDTGCHSIFADVERVGLSNGTRTQLAFYTKQARSVGLRDWLDPLRHQSEAEGLHVLVW